MPNKGKILAIDFGEKKTGLAVSDVTQSMIFGKGVLSGYKSLKDLFERILAVCKEDLIVEVVFGVPLGENGEETEQSLRLREIGSQLEEYLGTITVVYQDESFSSFEAAAAVKDAHLKKKYSEHELAAAVILERYLEIENW